METWINKKRRKKIIIVFCPVWLSVSHPLRSKLDNNRSATNSARIKEQEKSRNFNVQVQKRETEWIAQCRPRPTFCDKLEFITKKKQQQNYSHCHRHKYCNADRKPPVCVSEKRSKSIVSTGGNGSAQLSDNEREKNNRRNRKWWDIWFTSQKHYTK